MVVELDVVEEEGFEAVDGGGSDVVGEVEGF